MAITEEILHRFQDTQTLIVALPVLAVCVIIYALTYEPTSRNFPLIGYESGWTYKKSKDKFLAEGKKLLFDGLKLNRPYQVIMPSGPEIIFPSTYVNEFKNDKRLSFDLFVKKELFPEYPGFEGTRATLTNNVIQDTVRIKLTQSLNLITSDLCEETDFSISKIFGESSEWKSVSLPAAIPPFVARLSSRVFLGPVLAKDEEWLPVAVNYTIDLAQAARVLRLWPAISRPFVHWFLPECKALRARYRAGRDIISAEVERRRVKWEADAKAGRKVSKTADSLGWMQEIARESNVTDFDVVGSQLALTFAAIHTTSDLLSKCLIRLVREPQHLDALRKEMVEVLTREGGMKKTTLYQMKLLDSFMKEVQRIEPVGLTLMNRVAEERIVLKDGTVIPKGASIKVFGDGSYDPKKFDSPETFDPARFLKLRNQPGQENNWQFVTTSTDHMGFGHGMHACPGRFFASNEVKISLVWMLLKYDWRMIEGKEPTVFYYGGEIIAHPLNEIEMRRRKEEIDLNSLYEV